MAYQRDFWLTCKDFSATNVFNEETLEALEEAKLIAAHPENYKSYATFEEVLKDVFGPDYTLPKKPK